MASKQGTRCSSTMSTSTSRPPPKSACTPSSSRTRRSASARCARWASASSEFFDSRAVEAELRPRGKDLFPGIVVDRNAVALALRARFALRLAGDAHLVGARRGPALAQPVEELARLAAERVCRAESHRIDQHRQHAVQHALLLALVVVPRAAAGQRAAEELASHRQAVALVAAEREDRTERRNHRVARVIGRTALIVD